MKRKALKEGHFALQDELQGRRATYYAGAMVDYELTGTAAAWARTLVERHFPRIC